MSATVTGSASPIATPQVIDPRPHAQPRKRWWVTPLRAVPNLVVFCLLGGVMYLGHHTGWKMPKMSEVLGSATVANDDWCAEHLVPESACIECQTELVPKGKPLGFCKEHGVAECVIHHPDLAQVKGEAQLPKYDTLQAITLIARPENNSRNTMHTSRVQFASAESLAKVGVDVDVVQERPMTDAISANGELLFDPTRVGHLSTRIPGTVAAVFKTVGDHVEAGEILGLVDASLVGQAKSQLLQAVVQLHLRQAAVDRLKPIASSGAVAQKSVVEAESALREAEVALLSARQALENLGFELPEGFQTHDAPTLAEEFRFLGVPPSVLSTLPARTKTANLIPICATYAGVVVASEVVAGEVVDAAKPLFTVSDPSRMWLMLNVRQEDARYVRVGLPVRFISDNGEHKTSGEIAWINPAIDESTRTLQVRVNISNANGTLRGKTFGTGRIILREESQAIVVPREAVQSTPDAHFVFVRDKSFFDKESPKFFHVRQVRLGARDGQFVELLAGVLPGEVVATKGSNVLLAQLLRSNLGAGCGCHDH